MARPDQRRKTVTIGGGESHQTETVIAGIIIAAALLVGFFVVDAVDDATPATQTTTVTNETFTMTFTSNTTFYTVSKNGTDEEHGFLDNEAVYNSTSGTIQQLSEGESAEYEWYPANGTVKVFNTSAVANGTDAQITYSYNSHMNGYESTLDRIGDGLLIGGVVIIVLFAAVILRVLRGL